ncbi:RNA-guided endonuclease TnpB family protein [Chloroflexus sp.]|jgi:putative transposase|uniref:RNA-guided endonuclease InsQ/TnpB family protein n=1 Tax=Chloroflexus sp. TaxID=1904827 RepID=UPI000173C212|nr:RNA-guided endonuclease TnpB family protein [Chloroflexus sp.]GIV94082.1 MAG: transposase [Chloroflexus sp.]
MRVILTHKIELRPTKQQELLLREAVGVARFAYNWALDEWKKQYCAGLTPNEAALRRQLNAIKREQFPWMLRVPKSIPQQAIKNLGAAFKNFFERRAGYPTHKKKGRDDSARFDNGPGTFRCDGKCIRLPVIGWIRMREALRFTGKPLSATVSRVADRWYVAIPVEIDLPDPVCDNQAAVGVDLGVTTAATLSSGEKLAGPKALQANLERLRRLSRRHSRKVNGSKNQYKSALKLARLHARIANIRRDWLHKTTTRLVRTYGVIGIEDLNVRGMLGNRTLARHIADIGMYEFKRQLQYKAALYGVEVVEADRWFASSKTCSVCGAVTEQMPLGMRDWVCPACGTDHDRDVNAAKNLQRMALSRASCARRNACGEAGTGHGDTTMVNPASVKQESDLSCWGMV